MPYPRVLSPAKVARDTGMVLQVADGSGRKAVPH